MAVYNPQDYKPLGKQVFSGVLDFCIKDAAGNVVCFLSDGSCRVCYRPGKANITLVPRRRYVIRNGEIQYA